jgi:hypothetical protein
MKDSNICILHQILLGDKMKDEIDRACSTQGKIERAYKSLIGKSEEKRRLGRPRCRWEDNIRMDLREISWKVVDCTRGL